MSLRFGRSKQIITLDKQEKYWLNIGNENSDDFIGTSNGGKRSC